MSSCKRCNDDGASPGMDNMCADCYWDAEGDRKKAQRADPVWRFQRLVSFAMVCMSLNERAAVAFALREMKLDKPPTPLVAKKSLHSC